MSFITTVSMDCGHKRIVSGTFTSPRLMCPDCSKPRGVTKTKTMRAR